VDLHGILSTYLNSYLLTFSGVRVTFASYTDEEIHNYFRISFTYTEIP